MSETTTRTPLASILVCTYNHAPYIKECLESLANQITNFDFEVLVGEDCSTDDTRNIVLQLAERYPERIKPILNSSNLGANANSRNIRSQARGKYIAICEGDDYWQRSDKLQLQVDILENDSKVSLVCTDADAYYHNTGRRIKSVHERNGQWNTPHEDITLALVTRRINIFTCSVCIPRELLLRIHEENHYEFSPEHRMGDIQTWFELSKLGKVVPIRESCATYRVITESASRSLNYWKLLGFQEAALKIFEHYVGKFGYDDEILHQVRMTQVWGMIGLVMKHREEKLREHVLTVIQSRSMQPSSLPERIAFRALRSQSSVNRFAPFSSLFFKALRVPVKLRALPGRLRHHWKD
jgi:glycosyltransferase involved in cell wall biosynthesis